MAAAHRLVYCTQAGLLYTSPRVFDLETVYVCAGELVSDLASFLGIMDVASTADFPLIMQQFRTVLSRVSAGWASIQGRGIQHLFWSHNS